MYQQVFGLHAELLRAMSHPRRLEVIHLLRGRTLSVTQIQRMLDLPQANLSQHLQVLRQAGIVATEKKGKRIFYRLAHKNFAGASDMLREVLIRKHKDGPLADELTLKMADLVPVVKDPVCGMRISPKTAAYAHKASGQTFYFCASGCYQKFRANSGKFTK